MKNPESDPRLSDWVLKTYGIYARKIINDHTKGVAIDDSPINVDNIEKGNSIKKALRILHEHGYIKQWDSFVKENNNYYRYSSKKTYTFKACIDNKVFTERAKELAKKPDLSTKYPDDEWNKVEEAYPKVSSFKDNELIYIAFHLNDYVFNTVEKVSASLHGSHRYTYDTIVEKEKIPDVAKAMFLTKFNKFFEEEIAWVAEHYLGIKNNVLKHDYYLSALSLPDLGRISNVAELTLEQLNEKINAAKVMIEASTQILQNIEDLKSALEAKGDITKALCEAKELRYRKLLKEAPLYADNDRNSRLKELSRWALQKVHEGDLI